MPQARLTTFVCTSRRRTMGARSSRWARQKSQNAGPASAAGAAFAPTMDG